MTLIVAPVVELFVERSLTQVSTLLSRKGLENRLTILRIPPRKVSISLTAFSLRRRHGGTEVLLQLTTLLHLTLIRMLGAAACEQAVIAKIRCNPSLQGKKCSPTPGAIFVSSPMPNKEGVLPFLVNIRPTVTFELSVVKVVAPRKLSSPDTTARAPNALTRQRVNALTGRVTHTSCHARIAML